MCCGPTEQVVAVLGVVRLLPVTLEYESGLPYVWYPLIEHPRCVLHLAVGNLSGNCGRKKRDRKMTNKKKRKHHNRDCDGEQNKSEKSENGQRRLSLPIQTKCCCIPWESHPTINPTQKLCDWYQINQSVNQSIKRSRSIPETEENHSAE
jgi:hypothetical protein